MMMLFRDFVMGAERHSGLSKKAITQSRKNSDDVIFGFLQISAAAPGALPKRNHAITKYYLIQQEGLKLIFR